MSKNKGNKQKITDKLCLMKLLLKYCEREDTDFSKYRKASHWTSNS